MQNVDCSDFDDEDDRQKYDGADLVLMNAAAIDDVLARYLQAEEAALTNMTQPDMLPITRRNANAKPSSRRLPVNMELTIQ